MLGLPRSTMVLPGKPGELPPYPAWRALVFPRVGGLPWLTEHSAALRFKINMTQHSARFVTHGVCANEPSGWQTFLLRKLQRHRNCVMAKVTLVVALSMSCHLPASKQSPQPSCARHSEDRGGKHQHIRAEANPPAWLRTIPVSKYRRRVKDKQGKQAARHRSSKISYCSYKCWWWHST